MIYKFNLPTSSDHVETIPKWTIYAIFIVSFLTFILKDQIIIIDSGQLLSFVL